MRQTNQPTFAQFINRQAHQSSVTVDHSRSQKKTSNYHTENSNNKLFEGFVSRKPLSKLNENTNKDNSQDLSLNDRINASPLKLPLSRAIEKTVKNLNKQNNELEKSRRTFRNNNIVPGQNTPNQRQASRKYSTVNDESTYYGRVDQIELCLSNMHPETIGFLQKYFEPAEWTDLPCSLFVDKIVQEYENLWNNQQADQILEAFIDKLTNALGGEFVDLKVLQVLTKQDGVIGLILNTFKELKSQEGSTSMLYRDSSMTSLKKSFEDRLTANSSSDIQNIKNILQEYMETMEMYIQNQIYSKFTVEARRIIYYYKESQKILRTVNDMITQNIDCVQTEVKKRDVVKKLENEIKDLKDALLKQEIQVEKERLANNTFKAENQKLTAEIKKLNESLEKFQTHILKQNEYDPTLSRHTSLPLVDPHLSRHVSNPQIFASPHQKPRSSFLDMYENSILGGQNHQLNNLSNMPPPTLDIINSNINGVKSTSIIAPSPNGGKFKIELTTNQNTTVINSPSTTVTGPAFYTSPITTTMQMPSTNPTTPIMERSISIGIRNEREVNLTPPKLSFTRVEQSPFHKSRIIRP